MDNKSYYQDDLAGIKGMPLNPKDIPFIVPNDYFSTLETKIIRRVKTVSATEKSFAVPDQYFETLAARIQAKIKLAEQESPIDVHLNEDDDEGLFIKRLKEIAPSAGFSVPDGYFEALNTKMQHAADALASPDMPQKVIPINRKKKASAWISYVAAACIAIGIGTYTFFQMNTVNTFESSIKKIPDSDIVSYLEYYNESGDGAILETQFDGILQLNEQHFSEEEIEAYLDYSI